MREFKPLDESQPIEGKLFIEASAGTGKTFAIEHVVRRLILQGISLDEILITTFTRAGTRDLKRRIYENLEAANLKQALSLMDRAEIHTIHSFCHRMLTEYAFEAKVDPHLDVEEDGTKGQVRVAVFDTLRTLSNPKDFLTLVNACQRDVGRFVRKMTAFLSANQTIVEDTPFHTIAKKAQEKISSRKIKSPDSLLETMQDRLSLPAFKELVQKRFKAVIVDEFQDTDPRQWEIFYQLFYETAATFLVVGDPKQSIYAFRGADLKTFFKAKDHFSELYALSTNYRSAPGLVDACNQLFGGVKGLFTFQEEESVQYHPVRAGREGREGSIVVAVCEGEKGRSSSWPTQALEEEKIFPYIASEITRLGEKEIAVLVRDRYQASRLSDFLSKHGIPHISTATSNLVETKSFRFLELAFELAAHPRNLNFLKQFLLHPFVGWTVEKIACDLTDPDLQECVSFFAKLGHTLKEKGRAAFLRELLSKYSEDSGDLMQLVNLIIESDREPRELFEELKTLDPDEHPELKRKSYEKSNVTLMTTHMSKGLEFDIVFALGIASRSPEKEILHPLEADQEKMRLLYVSATRARETLYLLFPQNLDGKIPSLGTASPLELLLARQNQPFFSHQQTYAAIPKIQIIGIPMVPGPIRVRDRGAQRLERRPGDVVSWDGRMPPAGGDRARDRIFHHIPTLSPAKQYLSFSSLTTPHAFHTFPDHDPIPQGSHTGSLFHLLFEKIIEIGLYSPWNDSTILDFLQKELCGTHLEDRLHPVFELIKIAFHTPLDHFLLKDVPPENMLQEMQFLYQMEERKYMKGFADLVFLMNNRYYILDWKLNRLPAYEKTDLEQAMRDHQYTTQASIYAKALSYYLNQRNARFGGTFYFFLRGKEKGLLAL